jgi:hypothetical protein
LGDRIKINEIGGGLGMYGVEEISIQYFEGKAKGKRQLEISRCKYKDNTKMNRPELGRRLRLDRSGSGYGQGASYCEKKEIKYLFHTVREYSWLAEEISGSE